MIIFRAYFLKFYTFSLDIIPIIYFGLSPALVFECFALNIDALAIFNSYKNYREIKCELLYVFVFKSFKCLI